MPLPLIIFIQRAADTPLMTLPPRCYIFFAAAISRAMLLI